MSTLKTNTIKNTDDVEMYLAKAWVNFNGRNTVTIRAAGNVSSITDNGSGDYTVNFTNAMPDTNYATFCANRENYSNASSDTWGFLYEAQPTTTATRVQTGQTGGKFDSDEVNVVVFR